MTIDLKGVMSGDRSTDARLTDGSMFAGNGGICLAFKKTGRRPAIPAVTGGGFERTPHFHAKGKR